INHRASSRERARLPVPRFWFAATTARQNASRPSPQICVATSVDAVDDVHVRAGSPFTDLSDLRVLVAAVPVDRVFPRWELEHDSSPCRCLALEHLKVAAANDVTAAGGENARSRLGLVLVVACGI